MICDLVTSATPDTLVTLSATESYGVDFNPTALNGNALRVVNGAGQNLRIQTVPATTLGTNVAGEGQCATANDSALNTVMAGSSTPRAGVTAAGYTNSVSGATSTTLYYIDTTADRLTISTDPNGGLVGNVGGTLGTSLNLTAVNGFEITPSSNLASLAGQVEGETSTSLFNVNLVTGEATELGTVGGGQLIAGLTSRP